MLRGKFSHRPRNDPKLYDGDYPFVQTGDVASAGQYLTSYTQTLNETGYAVSKEFPIGTLVMAIAANIGDVAILKFSACFPDSIVGFQPDKSLDLHYLYYSALALKEELVSSAVMNTQLNLNIERIGSIKTVVPPIDEQRAICKYLQDETSKIDTLIAKARRAIELMREHRSALIAAAVTGKIDVRTA